jgi:hypothetical protein
LLLGRGRAILHGRALAVLALWLTVAVEVLVNIRWHVVGGVRGKVRHTSAAGTAVPGHLGNNLVRTYLLVGVFFERYVVVVMRDQKWKVV